MFYLSHTRITIAILAVAALCFATVGTVVALPKEPDEKSKDLESIEVIEKLGDHVPAGVTFVTDKGDTLRLFDLLHHEKPIILTLAYYECPMLCNLVLNGISESVGGLQDWNAGDQFQMLTVSIKPEETFELAASKKANYLREFTEKTGREFNPEGWIFAVAEGDESKLLANSVGFQYFKVEETGEYAHPAVTFIITPDGVISRYLYGLQHSPRNLKLALLEASEGKIGNAFDKVLLYCYQYDPDAQGYTVMATNVMKLAGAVTLVILVFGLGILWARERRRAKDEANQEHGHTPHANPVS